jgi:prophage antirepressor-like protein
MMIFLYFETHDIRFLLSDGQPWFIVSDVRRALGITGYLNVAGLDDGEWGTVAVGTPGGRDHFAAVGVSGLFAAIAHETTPEAGRFRRWVALEALPTIAAMSGAVLQAPRGRGDGLVSTTELAERLGMEPGLLGRRAKHLKTPAHGEERDAIALFSDRVVRQWLWNEAGRAAVLKQFGRRGADGAAGSPVRSRRPH